MIVVIVLLFIVVSAVMGFMWYRSQNANTKILQIEFNGDGTVSRHSVSGTEYFAYVTNSDSNGVSDKTDDDPLEFQYYTDKTTRDSVWNTMRNIPKDPEYRECTAPGCVRVSVTDKEGMQAMIDEVYADMKIGAKDMRAFLVQKGLYNTKLFVAKYKEYHPDGYYAWKFPESAVSQNDMLYHRFMFEVLIKGFAEFKNVPVPSDMTSENYRSETFGSFFDQLYPLSLFRFVIDIMYGHVKLSDGSTHQKILMTNGETTIDLRLGVDYPFSMGIILIPLILIIQEGQTIDSLVYNPPNNPKTSKQLFTAMATKRASLKRMPQGSGEIADSEI